VTDAALDLSADFAAMTDPAPPEAAPVPPPADPWLVRRGFGFGASDMANVLVALGWRHEDMLNDHQRKRNTRPRRKGIPRMHRVFLEKAGLVAPLKMSDDPRSPPNLGSEREPELVRRWGELIRRGQAGPDAAMLDADSIVYAERDFPREVLPLVDRESPRLTATPDVLVRDYLGRLGCWDAKCSVNAYGELREHHRIQVHAQMAVCAGEHGGILEGEGWAAAYRDHAGEPCGPIVSHGCERDDELIRELREAAREGWSRVEEARAAWEKQQ
jgi:hypothetical protein